MMATWSRRQVHHQLGQVLVFAYAFMAVTGIMWTVVRLWCNGSRDAAHIFMVLHQLEFFGFHYVYAPTLGIVSVVFLASGFGMTSIWWKRTLPPASRSMTQREWHSLIGIISVLPMLLLAVTGGAYAVAIHWFAADKDSVHWIIHLHNMAALHVGGVYPLVIGVLVVAQGYTGVPMTRMWRWVFPRKPRALTNCAEFQRIEEHDPLDEADSSENMLMSTESHLNDLDMDITALLPPATRNGGTTGT